MEVFGSGSCGAEYPEDDHDRMQQNVLAESVEGEKKTKKKKKKRFLDLDQSISNIFGRIIALCLESRTIPIHYNDQL